MTDLLRAARYAKEVLDYVDRFLNMNKAIRYELVRDAIADLDKALAQPEQKKESTAQTVDPRLLLGRSNNFTKETENRLCDIERRLAAIETQPALAQPEQVSIEPPDYVEPITFDYHEGWEEGFKAGVGSAKNKKESTPSNVDPLLHGGDGNYIKQAQPEQEPVAWLVSDAQGRYATIRDPAPYGEEVYEPLYAAPPKQWVGLYLDDMPDEYVMDRSFLRGARWAEAKLKEKNGG